jgi:hypothetical protein
LWRDSFIHPAFAAEIDLTASQGIRRLGFRRWYERQLIEGHVYFITAFLSVVLMAACLEQIDVRGSSWQLLFMITVIAATGWLCVIGLRRYNFLLVRAECFGSQSTCAKCKTYGVLQVLGAGHSEAAGDAPRLDDEWIRVRCKKCDHEWRMERN